MSVLYQVNISVLGGTISVTADHDNAHRLISQMNSPQPVMSIKAIPDEAATIRIPAETADMAQEQILALIVAGGDAIADLLSPTQPLAAVLDALLPLWRPMVSSMLDRIEQ